MLLNVKFSDFSYDYSILVAFCLLFNFFCYIYFTSKATLRLWYQNIFNLEESFLFSFWENIIKSSFFLKKFSWFCWCWKCFRFLSFWLSIDDNYMSLTASIISVLSKPSILLGLSIRCDMKLYNAGSFDFDRYNYC